VAEPGLSTTTPHVRFAGAGGQRQTALILHSLSSKLGYPFGHIAASAVLSDELGNVVAPPYAGEHPSRVQAHARHAVEGAFRGH
jgi:hypothetical protein